MKPPFLAILCAWALLAGCTQSFPLASVPEEAAPSEPPPVFGPQLPGQPEQDREKVVLVPEKPFVPPSLDLNVIPGKPALNLSVQEDSTLLIEYENLTGQEIHGRLEYWIRGKFHDWVLIDLGAKEKGSRERKLPFFMLETGMNRVCVLSEEFHAQACTEVEGLGEKKE